MYFADFQCHLFAFFPKSTAKVQKINDLCKFFALKFAYFKKKQYFCTRFMSVNGFHAAWHPIRMALGTQTEAGGCLRTEERRQWSHLAISEAVCSYATHLPNARGYLVLTAGRVVV